MLNDVFQIDNTVERLEYLMNKGGVDKTIIFPVTYKDYTEPNKEVAEIVNKNKRFIGFGRVVSGSPDAPAQVEYAIKELGLRGIKLHSMDGFPTREVMDKIREMKVPVVAHSGMGLAPITFEGVIKSYPDIPIILAHLGFDQNWSNMFSSPLQAFYLARKYKNVYLDTAAANWVQYILEQAIEEVGPDKIIFGTDAPWFYPAIMKACINDLEISDTDRAKILGGNIARLLNL
jgi:predicted TIM-barrel fold metal-dependent hydrolase